jgi:HlyD family secretion protein
VVDGRAEEVQVTVGTSHGERVEIVSGLEAGDSVVVVGQDNLRPGAAVLVMEVNGTAVASTSAESSALARQRTTDPTAAGTDHAGTAAGSAAQGRSVPDQDAGTATEVAVIPPGAGSPEGSGARPGGGP